MKHSWNKRSFKPRSFRQCSETALLGDDRGADTDSVFLAQAKLRAWEALGKVLSVNDESADSDEAFLEQAKLKAHEALKNVLLGDDAAADSDDTFLEQAKLEACKTWRTLCWMASKPMLGSRSCRSLKGTQYSRLKLSSFG